jgi:triosephosphate isomerase
MRKIIIVANWKMNKTDNEVLFFIKKFAKNISDVDNLIDQEVVICPSFVSLKTASEAAKGTAIKIGAQNMHYEDSGAYTGEVSSAFIKDFCDYVIIGHSERRSIFNETDEIINKKIIKALSAGFKVIFCIGEHLDEMESGKTNEILSSQINAGLHSVNPDLFNNLIIAYEPVWAIGTGKSATSDVVQKTHRFIRKKISDMYSEKEADNMRIIYGGSVKPENIKELMAEKDIDGTLVGGASLDISAFMSIIRYDKS